MRYKKALKEITKLIAVNNTLKKQLDASEQSNFAVMARLFKTPGQEQGDAQQHDR
jgi:hypothetical protein